MYDRYGYPGFFAAYNAGPARFDDYLLRGVPLPEETQHYLLSIGPDVREAVLAARPDIAVEARPNTRRTITSDSGSALFFPLGTPLATTPRTSIDAANDRLSALHFARQSPRPGDLFVRLRSPHGTAIGAVEGP